MVNNVNRSKLMIMQCMLKMDNTNYKDKVTSFNKSKTRSTLNIWIASCEQKNSIDIFVFEL